MAAIFQDGRHGLYWTTTLGLKVAADSQKIILGINYMYWTLRIRNWFHKQSQCPDIYNIDQKFYIFNVEWIYRIQ